MVRTESKNPYDQGESAILELVDGIRDSRFMMTAKTVARDRLLGRESTPVTIQNIKKTTQFRGEKEFEDMVQEFMILSTADANAPSAKASESESAKMAQRDGAAAQNMGAHIVPESVKQSARGSQKEAR